MVHPVDLCRIQKALHVFAESKDGWATFGGITPDAFEDAGAVMKNVRHHVHARVVPLDKLSIMPDDVTNSWSTHVFHLAIFWKHILTPSGKSDRAKKGARVPHVKY
jgi:hypothetical protein